MTKLDSRAIAEIRERRAAGEKLYSISVDYNISEPYASQLCSRDVKRAPKVAGPHKATEYQEMLLACPPRGWAHWKRCRTSAYARGCASVLSTLHLHCEWTTCGSAVWMRRKPT